MKFCVIILLAMSSCATPKLEPPVTKGLGQVPPADLSATQRARTPADWKNPFLLISAEGFEMSRSHGASGDNSVSVDRMREILLDVPVESWPYGRIVAVQEICIRSRNDGTSIDRNRRELERMLKDLDITINWWPC
ncbi:MAG TPA: hypothetical protein VLG74_01975 [Blastocatellia bacterium]|nr:hypothetical protein [Blastocatellia bacterium]